MGKPNMLLQNHEASRNRADSFHSTPLGRSAGDVTRITARIGEGDNARDQTFTGRTAWALNELIRSGACTPLTHVGPRWSDYCFKLRRAGVEIETVTEAHGGNFRGHHGRYILRSPVTVLEIQRAGAQ